MLGNQKIPNQTKQNQNPNIMQHILEKGRKFLSLSLFLIYLKLLQI
jgi:hypothetical protein